MKTCVCGKCNQLSKKEINDKFDQELHKELVENNEIYLWMSFADPDKPKGHQFLGVIITKCFGMAHAVDKINTLGINPGGEIWVEETNPNDFQPEHFDTLLTEEQLSDISEKVQ